MERQVRETKQRLQAVKKKGNKENYPQNLSKAVDSEKFKHCSTISQESLRFENVGENTAGLKALQNELRVYKKALNESQARNAANIKEIAKLQHELGVVRSKHQVTQDILDKTTNEKANLEKVVKELKYEKTALLRENEHIKFKLAEQMRSNAIEDSHEKCKDRIKELEISKKKVEGRVAKYKAEVKKMRTHIHVMKEKIEELNQIQTEETTKKNVESDALTLDTLERCFDVLKTLNTELTSSRTKELEGNVQADCNNFDPYIPSPVEESLAEETPIEKYAIEDNPEIGPSEITPCACSEDNNELNAYLFDY